MSEDGFNLHIDLGNAAMSQPEHVAERLEAVGEALRGSNDLEGTIRDVNGNSVGRYSFRHPGSSDYEEGRRYTTEELEALPVLSQGQADDLHIEDRDAGVRVWLSRTGVADGEPFENTVTVERRKDGRWETDEKYNGDDTDELWEGED